MTPEKLVHMANEIAAFFHPYPADDARAGIRDHIHAFWTPEMRRGLATILVQGGDGLDASVVAAMRSDAAPVPSKEPVAA
jgi:formate dehydrogenase subunit delta